MQGKFGVQDRKNSATKHRRIVFSLHYKSIFAAGSLLPSWLPLSYPDAMSNLDF